MLRKKTQEIFGADNWLEKELERESRISAWDMDGGRQQLRMEHEAGCDARNLAAKHALNCEAEENAAQHRTEHKAEQTAPGFRKALGNVAGDENGNIDSKKAAVIGMAMLIAVIAAAPILIPLLPVIIVGLAIRANKLNNSK